MKRITSLACALLLVPTLAAAQPKTPGDWYKEGETQYNLGNFDAAVEAFKKGFTLETSDSKKSAYLYNIAQSYRQAKDCSNAQFFYKRFLALREADTSKPLPPQVRKDVDDRIKELEECARQQEAIRNRPPDGSMKPEPDPEPTTPEPTKPEPTKVGVVDEVEEDNEDDEDAGGITARGETAPGVLSARVAAGGALVTLGSTTAPIQGTFALIAGYPLALGPKLQLEVGPGFTFTPLPFDSMSTGASGTIGLTAAVANAGLRYAAMPKLAFRGDLGLGLLFMSGASNSHFTDGAETTGALTMFHVRAGVSADYELTPNLVATVPLAFSYSPAKAGLSEDIKAITAFDFMVGIGYRM